MKMKTTKKAADDDSDEDEEEEDDDDSGFDTESSLMICLLQEIKKWEL